MSIRTDTTNRPKLRNTDMGHIYHKLSMSGPMLQRYEQIFAAHGVSNVFDLAWIPDDHFDMLVTQLPSGPVRERVQNLRNVK